MLVLTRKVGESLIIDGRIKVTVIRCRSRSAVQVGITADRDVRVVREEVLLREEEADRDAT